jgi:hypothetical protein
MEDLAEPGIPAESVEARIDAEVLDPRGLFLTGLVDPFDGTVAPESRPDETDVERNGLPSASSSRNWSRIRSASTLLRLEP